MFLYDIKFKAFLFNMSVINKIYIKYIYRYIYRFFMNKYVKKKIINANNKSIS